MRWQELKAEWNQNPKYRAALRTEFPYRHLADELVAVRAGLGLTQEELAAKMKTSQSVIARLESGRHPVTTATLSRIATALAMNWRIAFEPGDLSEMEVLAGFEIQMPKPRESSVPSTARSKKRAKASAGENSYALAA